MIELAGYDIFEQIYGGNKTLVYRGLRQCDRQPVILKFLNKEYPSFSELLQFRNQYTIAKNLDLSGIIRPYSLESYRNSYALVMEDWGGLSLNHLTYQLNPFSLEEILSIAIQLAEILHGLHQNRVIHKDIKPANILIHPQSKKVKLIDFSIASLLPKETQEIKNPNGLEGTLAYISPEQTGRMNRGVDYRSDFYSLGVTLFELLTGKLPFSSTDPMELVHCHIAKMPEEFESRGLGSGSQGKIPPGLSNVVMKLMAKNAEDRYQSALGLKFDLENCLTQLKKIGKIEGFEIGTWDVCDRFIIPEKLYGRETEVETLLAAFERVASLLIQGEKRGVELMLVAGFSGIGKTAVVNEIHKPIVRQRGYFIKGKFDQFNRNTPFWAFVQSFRDLMGQLLAESDTQLQTWKAKILEALGENAQVIIEVIPDLERIIGVQPTVPELSGTAAQNRFNLLFPKFIQVFATKEHPLVLFLDDLQWADSASLQLLQLLMEESQTSYLLVIGAYRDNEVFPAHPLILTLDEVSKTGATVNKITLESLSETSLNQLVADTLACLIEVAQPLTELVYQKTKGNPFFATQFLKALHQDGSITFDLQSGHWQCDIIQVREAALTDDVVEFMAMQLQKLPAQTQDVLKLAACIGNQFDLATLAIVSECSQIEAATHLWKALQDSLILPQSEVYKFYQDRDRSQPLPVTHNQLPTYKFLHDRVQQAAYSLIPENQKQATHLQIGQLLQQNLSDLEKEEELFDLVGHLNLGQALITQPARREALAQLNLAAGEKARKATAYAAAQVYLHAGIEILTANCWQSQYQLTLNLYVAAAEAAYLNADPDLMNQLAAVVLKEARTILDRVKIYEIQIADRTAKGKMLEAIAVGRPALAQLGVELPINPNEVEIARTLENLASQLQDKSMAELLDQPEMTDPQTLAAMQLLCAIFASIFMGMPGLLPSLSATIVQLSLQFGNTPASAVGYVSYGVLLCNALADPVTGYRFGKLAMNLLDAYSQSLPEYRFMAQKLQPIISVLFGGCIQYRQEALRTTISTQIQGYRAGIETGEFLYAGYNLVNAATAGFFAGVELDTLEPEIAGYRAVMAQTKQDSARTYLDMQQQMMQNLTEVVSQPESLVGTLYDETVMLPQHKRDNELTACVFVYMFKLVLAYSFGNYRAALDSVSQVRLYDRALQGTPFAAVFHFYAALAYLAVCSAGQESVEMLKQVETHQTILHEWAQTAPMNYRHKWDLVEAERQRVLGNLGEAIGLYDLAIAGAEENRYIQEEALAKELAAKFYLDWRKEKLAAGYMQEAYYCYARWGAKAKADDLEDRYPDLLCSILQQTAQPLNILETLATITAPKLSIQTSIDLSCSSSSSINAALDLAAIFKASQSLSSTIQIDELLYQLTQIILQNSGADRCALILPNDHEQWELQALAIPGKTERCSEPLENNPRLPVKLIQYVKHTQTVVVIDALKTELPVIGEYLSQHKPKSMLCLPLLDRGQLRGILSLENRSTAGVFTRDRLLILNFLCTQAAISLENARLYQKAQDYAQQLEQSQLQLVQSEKMSALGNLVAGVAHEINNPVGFIAGNLKPAQDYVQDLLGLIDLYQEKMPEPDDDIADEIEAIDLEFIREDLPKLIGSMKEGTDRIGHISNSLRTFSRADSDRPTLFNIHDGIDSTLLILKHRLKVSDRRPEIEVLKYYGNFPQINCFAGQLNQVFMNIIANAIDAIDEGVEKGEISQPCIRIQTEALAKSVIIRIKDSGMGMPKSVQAHIFDRLFTTKGVGKGTGLGLAIARQIVEDKHKGKLKVQSKLGEGTEFAIVLPVEPSG